MKQAGDADAGGSGADSMGLADQKVLSFNFEGYGEDGRKKWEIEGTSANILAGVIDLEKVNAHAYNDLADVTITADAGVFNKDTKNMLLRRNVEVHTSDGLSLFTNSLCWAAETEEVSTDDPVRIIREDVTTTATGALAKTKEKQVTLKKDIAVDFTSPDTTITCDGPLEFDYENAVAVFHDNVVIVDAEGKIFADMMTAYFNQEAKKLERVIAEGNVVIERGQSRSMSEKAIYDANTRKVSLEGKPRLIINTQDDMGGFGMDGFLGGSGGKKEPAATGAPADEQPSP